MTFEDHTASREENNESRRNTEKAKKRKSQQSPITNYFKERKTVQGNDAKRAKQENTGKLT